MYNIYNSIRILTEECEKMETQIEVLRKENIRLKEEHYKDNELQELDEKCNVLAKRCQHLGLSESEWNELNEWRKKHEQVHKHKQNNENVMKKARYSFKYEIAEFAECTAYTIKCSCGESHTIYR